MVCNTVFAAAKIKKYLCLQDKLVPQTGEGTAAELEKWKDTQQDIYRHFTLTCSSPANTTILSIDPDLENMGRS